MDCLLCGASRRGGDREALCHGVRLCGKFVEHHIDMFSYVRRKCQTPAGVSRDINKTLKCVTITDSKLFNGVLK